MARLSATVLAIVLLSNALSPASSFQLYQAPKTSSSFVARPSSLPSNVSSQNKNSVNNNIDATVFSRKGSMSSLHSTAGAQNEGTQKQLDTEALGKYALAAGIQMSLFTGAFKLLDVLVASIPAIDASSIPFPAVAFLFYAIALKSRVFNPLNNQRPDRARAVGGEKSAGFQDRVMPSWTPPGVFFPIMWLLIIGPIRAYTSALIFEANGNVFCDAALLSLIFHLTCGDIWNTINNSERRYGASVPGIVCVVASVAFAASQYYAVDPFAGKLLGATALWLITAGALIVDTWRLNPGPDGERDPLYPVVGEAKTEFEWFSSKD